MFQNFCHFMNKNTNKIRILNRINISDVFKSYGYDVFNLCYQHLQPIQISRNSSSMASYEEFQSDIVWNKIFFVFNTISFMRMNFGMIYTHIFM